MAGFGGVAAEEAAAADVAAEAAAAARCRDLLLLKMSITTLLRCLLTEQAGRPEESSGLTQTSQWFCEFNAYSTQSPAGREPAQPDAGTEHGLNTH